MIAWSLGVNPPELEDISELNFPNLRIESRTGHQTTSFPGRSVYLSLDDGNLFRPAPIETSKFDNNAWKVHPLGSKRRDGEMKSIK